MLIYVYINNVFHVSQLKPALGSGHQISSLPDSFAQRSELIVEPEAVLETRYDNGGHLEALVQWKGLPAHETTWVRASELLKEFPELEDKLCLDEGGNVRLLNRFVRRRKKVGLAITGNDESLIQPEG
ncbi:unnamed protein product [Microthlaspi erraticum]|uniref:Chromo domain-containing protein n=1 Tax=Microthlaspi erraticum TaxID=1685480 RepID=A0A6D2HKX8_9BRAS|nr:unnamed protein product [Microthlaspi erraticum]